MIKICIEYKTLFEHSLLFSDISNLVKIPKFFIIYDVVTLLNLYFILFSNFIFNKSILLLMKSMTLYIL
jgi:hypothetical protein